MRGIFKREINYLKDKGNYIVALLIAVEVLSLLLEESLGIVFSAYFIFPEIVTSSYINYKVKKIDTIKIFFELMAVYLIIIPIYIAIHMFFYGLIAINVSDVKEISLVTCIVSIFFFIIRILYNKRDELFKNYISQHK